MSNPSAHYRSVTRRAALVASTWAAIGLGGIAPALAALDDQAGEATATLAPTQGSNASGTAAFKNAGKDGVRLLVEMTGLKPGSAHGMHVHEHGDCGAPDASSAGAHFALAGQKHGSPEGTSHHAGDLGNLRADAQGKASASVLVPSNKLTVAPGPLSVVGRALVVHAGTDDLETQPSGNSGGRIACGVIDRQTVTDGQSPMKPIGR